MLSRSKLNSGEYICDDCRKKANAFARMDYSSKEDVQRMMDTLGDEFTAFVAGEVSGWHVYQVGRTRVQYRKDVDAGKFQLLTDDVQRFDCLPVLLFAKLRPYEMVPEGSVFERSDVPNVDDDFAVVTEEKDMDGEVTGYVLTIPYDDPCIREIRFKASADGGDADEFNDLAREINDDRRTWISKGEWQESRKNEMHVRNIGDTAAAALKAAVTGGDVKAELEKGVEMAQDIEEGKVEQGLFGSLKKLFK